MLSEQRVEKFRDLYQKHFGREISVEEARERAQKWAHFVSLVCHAAEKNGIAERTKNP